MHITKDSSLGPVGGWLGREGTAVVHSRAWQLIMQHWTSAGPCLQDHSLAYVMSSTSKVQGVSWYAVLLLVCMQTQAGGTSSDAVQEPAVMQYRDQH